MSFPFSGPAIAALVDAIEGAFTHAQMRSLFLRIGVEQWDPGQGNANKAVRAQSVIEGLRSEHGQEATRAALRLAQEVLAVGGEDTPWRGASQWWRPLVTALAADGWEYDSSAKRLMPAVEAMSITDERGLLERQLMDLGWETAATHYRQAAAGISAEHWESANGQLRSFLESFLPQAAAKMLGTPIPKNPLAGLQNLMDRGLLLEGEFDFARGLWKLCNKRGSHAGRSDPEEARFRFLAATGYGRFFLSRLS